MRHGDTGERLRHNHANPDIDKSRTEQNISLYHGGFANTLNRYGQRIDILRPNSRLTSRSVTLLSIECPYPGTVKNDGTIDHARLQRASAAFFHVLQNTYGHDNIIQINVHMDEVHKYIDKDGIQRWSLPHAHAYIIPEYKGRICAKELVTREHLRTIQQNMHTAYTRYVGIDFLKGTEPQKKTVEVLKAEQDTEKQLREKLGYIRKEKVSLQSDLNQAERELGKIQNHIKSIHVDIDNAHKDLRGAENAHKSLLKQIEQIDQELNFLRKKKSAIVSEKQQLQEKIDTVGEQIREQVSAFIGGISKNDNGEWVVPDELPLPAAQFYHTWTTSRGEKDDYLDTLQQIDADNYDYDR